MSYVFLWCSTFYGPCPLLSSYDIWKPCLYKLLQLSPIQFPDFERKVKRKGKGDKPTQHLPLRHTSSSLFPSFFLNTESGGEGEAEAGTLPSKGGIWRVTSGIRRLSRACKRNFLRGYTKFLFPFPNWEERSGTKQNQQGGQNMGMGSNMAREGSNSQNSLWSRVLSGFSNMESMSTHWCGITVAKYSNSKKQACS